MQYFERIRNLREDAEPKLNQTDIAKVLGTTQQYYSEYENGKRKLPLDQLIKLCQFYNVSADYILGLPKGMSYPER
ncbi:MAG: helix-turn-helix transcriptional regulator [Clostridia bacterium]|nr:helix-turn-helix transcriptional regulator [Clostridia bacterium]